MRLFTLLCLFSFSLSVAQQVEWPLGYPVSVVTFSGTQPAQRQINEPSIIYMLTTCASICGADSQLLFFSNGVRLYDKNGYDIQEAYGFHPPQLEAFYNGVAGSTQEALILPKKGSTFYYFNYSMTDSNYIGLKPFDLVRYSVVDMAANNNWGLVVEKNHDILSSVNLAPYGLTACRHANGRDWWLIMSKAVKNAYYEFLVTPDTVIGPVYQEVSPAALGTLTPHGQSTFSNNGEALATTNFNGGVKLMHFDRCSGAITPWADLIIPYDSITQYGIGGNGVAFSDNGRFLYANTFKKVFQFDLSDTSIQQSVMEVGAEPDTLSTWFDPMQIAPNGKIYVSNANGFTNSYSLINYPDQKGLNCAFTYHSDTLFASLAAVGVPNVPNFKLGALTGSACDTLSGIGEQLPLAANALRIYPSPADNRVWIGIDQLNGAGGAGELEVYDYSGKLVHKSTVNLYNTNTLATEAWPPGLYVVQVATGAGRRFTGRFAVVH